jgi:hypothetical protein
MKKFIGGIYIGRSRAVVIDNRDPKLRGRIRVKHPLLGQSTWIDYINSPTLFDPPEVGDIVFVECESTEYEYPVAHGKVIKGPDGEIVLLDDFQREVPTNRGFKSPGGHTLELDDGIYIPTDSAGLNEVTTEDKGIRITTSAGNKIHIREDEGFRKDGTTVESEIKQFILIEDVNGNQIKLDYKDNKITILSKGTHETTTTTDRSDLVGGNYGETTNGNKTEVVNGNKTSQVDLDETDTVSGKRASNITGDDTNTVGGKLTLEVTGDVVINCANAKITCSANAEVTAAEIQLNGTAGDVLTNTTDPVVDTIFGTPTIGVTTVKSG